MGTIHITGDNEISTEEAERATRNYTASPAEQAEETPDEVDNSPLSDSELTTLDEASRPTFVGVEQQQSERAETFHISGEWESPVVKARRKRAMMLPPVGQISDLQQRIAAVVRFDGAPAEVTQAAAKAREALAGANEVHQASQHSENRRFARDVAAKDATVAAIAKATSAVAALESVARDETVREKWFAGLVEGIDQERAEALKALRAAEKAYAKVRRSISAAQALAVEAGMWDKSWHMSTTSEIDLNRPTSSMREAIRFLADGDDYTDGSFLTADYGDEIPPHTLAKLKRGAEVAGGGSFAAQLFARAVSPMKNDQDAQEAISQRRLLILMNSNPSTAELLGRKDD